jgi:carbonic anhydrase
MAVFDELVAANRRYVEAGRHHPLPVRPGRQLAIVTCMDARIDTFDALGLALGDAHVIRTAGARVTDDVLRSLTLSTAVLGTRSVALIGHTDCGVRDPEGTLVDRLTEVLGHVPMGRAWGGFDDVEQAVTDDCGVLRRWPDAPDGFRVAGYVLDVTDGSLQEVVAPTDAA